MNQYQSLFSIYEFNEGNYKAICQLRKESKAETVFLSSVLKMLNN